MTELFVVMDVESVGLHGEGFAVGYVVVNRAGVLLAEALFACPPEAARGEAANLLWVLEHVPLLEHTHEAPVQVRGAFWGEWLKWRERGALLVADCGWPVETNFLSACVADEPATREWTGPYPLLDLASFLVATGQDPLVSRERKHNELPVHHPLADARQSARLLAETFTSTNPTPSPVVSA